MLLALASILSLQFEAGLAHMEQGQDDLYYDQQLPHNIQFNTPAFGVGLRFHIIDGWRATVGYRDLGHQEINTTLLDDTVYFKCRDVTHNCLTLTPIESWDVHIHTQQQYIETSYAFKLGQRGWRLVPSIGLSLNQERIDVNNTLINGYGAHNGVPHPPQHIQGGSQRNLEPFGGIALEKGNWGVGVYILDTQPQSIMPTKNDHTNADWYPGEGNTTYLFRVTYAWSVLK